MALYHYTSAHGLLGILNSGQLHCTNVAFLNDPSETTYFNRIVDKVCSNSDECLLIYKTLHNDSYISNILSLKKYAISFCKNPDLLCMWNHYAKGQGYNLGFNLDLIVSKNENSFILDKIELVYDLEQQVRELSSFILGFKDKYCHFVECTQALQKCEDENEANKWSDIENHITVEFNDAILNLRQRFKHSSYSHEEEVRIIVTERPSMYLNEDYKISHNGVIMPFVRLEIDVTKCIDSIWINPSSGGTHVLGVQHYLSSKILKNNIEVKVIESAIPFREI